MRAIVALWLSLPVEDTFAVCTKVPVLLACRMTLATYAPGLVETHLAASQSMKFVAIFLIVTNQAPQAAFTVFQADVMHGCQFARLEVCFPMLMTLGTWIETQLVFTRWHYWGRAVVIAAEVRLWSAGLCR